MAANPQYENIPAELRYTGRWIRCNGKKPIGAFATEEAKAAKMSTFARMARHRRPKENLARLIEKSESYTYVDLDKVRDPKTAAIQPWAEKIIEELNTYCEISGSGTGFHLVARGTLPEDYSVTYPDAERPDHSKCVPVELKSGNTKNRLFTITGDQYEFYSAINDRQKELEQMLARCKAGEFGGPKHSAPERSSKPDAAIAVIKPARDADADLPLECP